MTIEALRDEQDAAIAEIRRHADHRSAALSGFADDLSVSLEQVYARARLGGLGIYGGKFENPFTRTGLVFDSDVNPQGLSALVQS